MQHIKLEHRFVQYIPELLDPGVLYISMEYATAAHGCCCGCGLQVVTPFTPNDWKLTYDGETVSLWPSIGNWNFPCRSHYIIRHSRIVGAESWEDYKVEKGPEQDHKQKRKSDKSEPDCKDAESLPMRPVSSDNHGLWERIKKKVGKKKRQR